LDTNDIKSIMELFAKLPLNEMKLESGEHTLRLAKETSSKETVIKQPVNNPAILEQVVPVSEIPIEDPQLKYVTSPIVGTFYLAPNPTAVPFIKVGDSVHQGQVLCIVEAMKLMNEIQSEVSGVVHEILVENAQPVEYGQNLFSLK